MAELSRLPNIPSPQELRIAQVRGILPRPTLSGMESIHPDMSTDEAMGYCGQVAQDMSQLTGAEVDTFKIRKVVGATSSEPGSERLSREERFGRACVKCPLTDAIGIGIGNCPARKTLHEIMQANKPF